MPLIRWTVFAAAWFLAICSVATAASKTPDVLFQDQDVVDISIVAPLNTLLKERPFEEELPGKLTFVDAAGTTTELDIELRTRGKFRRMKSVCRFPPLRINFKKLQVKNTLFDKQDKLKLVTHCQTSKRYEQFLLREYVAYGILNTVTNVSYRARLLRITYVDSEAKRNDVVRYGFFIEHRDRLAKRLQKPALIVSDTDIGSLDPGHTNLVSVYHYLIGNTDYSPIQGPEDDMCCHNHDLFGNEGELFWSVPYDFDQSGLVDAPHGVVNERFRIRNARQRLYRGRCRNKQWLPASLATFRDKKDEIMQLVNDSPGLDRRSQKSMNAFIERFYDTLESEKRIASEFMRSCE